LDFMLLFFIYAECQMVSACRSMQAILVVKQSSCTAV